MPTDPDNHRQGAATGTPPEGKPRRGRAYPSVDASVVEGVRKADPEALGTFFDVFFDRIYGLAYRLLGNRAQAEDATQEVCYRIQRGARKLDPTRDPAPWVLTTTVNVCRSLWRSSAHRMDRASSSLDGTTGAEWATGPAHAPDAGLLAHERERLVIQAVQELDEAMREVVVLHDYQGLDHKEIASALGLSHEAVRKRYSRALASLAPRLRSIIE